MSQSHRTRALNALKHGVYSNLGILPNEDREEFDRLHQSLIVEFEPSGPTEKDAVLSLAKVMWRKSQLAIYRVADMARETFGSVFANQDDPFWDFDLEFINGSLKQRNGRITA